MTQALLNNLIKQPDLSEKLAGSKNNVTSDFKNDFQKVFDKQRVQDSETSIKRNKIGDEARKAGESQEQNTTDKPAEQNSIARDIRDLIAFIETTAKDSTTAVNSEETTEETIDNAENILTETEEDTAETTEEEPVEDSENSENTEDTPINVTESKENYIDPQAVITTVQQNTADTANANSIQNNNSTEEDSELNVTLNGKELTSFDDLTAINNDTAEAATQVKSESNAETEGKTLEEIVDEDMLKELKIESTEAETSSDSSGESDIMQQQSPEEQGVKAMLQNDTDFASDLGTSFTNGASTQNGIQGTNAAGGSNTASVEITPSKIIEQITKQMEGMQNGSKLNIVLNPESLGKVSIQLINTKEGLSAQFTVATQDARNLIMKGLDGLKDTLVSHGVSVDNVTVKLNDTQESEYNTDWTEQEGSRGGNKEQNPQREQRDKEQFDRMMSFIENENGKV